jgi:hypothetical protein
MNWVPQRNLHKKIFFTVLRRNTNKARLQTNDIIKSDPNTLYDEYWKDDIQTWPHLHDWNATFYE